MRPYKVTVMRTMLNAETRWVDAVMAIEGHPAATL
jgi:hypothetical protein